MASRDRTRKYMIRLNRWEQTGSGVEANLVEVPHLEPPLSKLRGLLTEARTLSTQLNLLTASKQETSKRLQQVLQEGETLVDFLRTGARQHFGNRSEKLIEFGLQPFRSRPRGEAPETPEPVEPEEPEPEEPSPTPSSEAPK